MNANFNRNADINQSLQSIFAMKNAGRNPQMILQVLMQQNPQVGQLMTTFKNMTNGQNPRDFVTQLARQSGVNEQNMAQIMSMFH